QWNKNNSPLTDGPGVSGSTTSSLTLSNLQSGDNGATITCTLTDDCGAGAAVTSAVATLTVSTGPTVSAASSVTVPAGTPDQRFDANVTKYVGQVHYQWQISGVNAPPDNQPCACGAIVTGGTTSSIHLKNIP